MIRGVARRVRLLALVGLVRGLAVVVRVRRRLGRGARHRESGPVAVIGAYGNGNYGDDAIGLGIARSLGELGHGTRFLGRLPDGSRLTEATTEPYRCVGGGVGGVWRALRAGRGCSAAVLGGGGLLEGERDNVHVQRLVLEYVAKLLACGVGGRPVYVHGIGVSDRFYGSPAVTTAIVHALRAADGVSVRDAKSRRALGDVGVDAMLVRDPALAILHAWSTDVAPRPGVLAFVGLDRVRWPTFEPGSAKAERARTDAIAGIVTDLERCAEGATTLELLPFHHSDPPFLEAVRDAVLAAPFAADLDVRPVADYPLTSARDAFSELMGAERVLTMRFHPALAVLTAGREVEIVGGLQKLAALREVAEPSSAVFPPEFADPDDALRAWFAPRSRG